MLKSFLTFKAEAIFWHNFCALHFLNVRPTIFISYVIASSTCSIASFRPVTACERDCRCLTVASNLCWHLSAVLCIISFSCILEMWQMCEQTATSNLETGLNLRLTVKSDSRLIYRTAVTWAKLWRQVCIATQAHEMKGKLFRSHLRDFCQRVSSEASVQQKTVKIAMELIPWTDTRNFPAVLVDWIGDLQNSHRHFDFRIRAVRCNMNFHTFKVSFENGSRAIWIL